jgi:hypothetical protein
MMQGLTDAAFEQRFGAEDACLAALAATRADWLIGGLFLCQCERTKKLKILR